MGMYMMRQIGTRGVYGNPILAGFHGLPAWKDLPGTGFGFDHFFLVCRRPWCCWLAGLLGFSSGCSPSVRGHGVYLSIITSADLCADAGFFRNDMGFGGNNG